MSLIITSLRIHNFKKIEVLSLDPESGEPVIIAGDNAAGKSSVLDSIFFALTGKGVTEPVHEGAKSGSITLEIGGEKVEYVIERRFSNEGKSLVVNRADGGKVPKPQEFVNSLLGSLAYDPEEFVRAKEKERAEALRIAAGLDFRELDETAKRDFDRRTNVNRNLKEAKAAKKNLGPAPAPVDEPPPFSKIQQEMEECSAVVREKDTLAKQVEQDDEKIGAIQDDIGTAEAELKSLEEAIARQKEHIETRKKDLDQLKFRTNKTKTLLKKAGPLAEAAAERKRELSAELQKIDEKQSARSLYLADKEERQRLSKRIDELELESAKLSASIKECADKRKEMIAKAPLPEGVEFTEDGQVRFDGRPFSDLNTASQWKISVQLAVLQNPKLGVIMIKEGALMNREVKAFLFGWAKERGMQVWVEQFQEEPREGDKGLFLVEGKVEFADGKPVA